jgi:hypothetical protein
VTAVLVFLITSRIDNKLREKNNKHEFIRNREYDTHENVYEEIQKLKNDPETGWAFRSSKKEKLEGDHGRNEKFDFVNIFLFPGWSIVLKNKYKVWTACLR